MRFDEWVYVANTKLRPLVATYLQSKDGSAISAQLKQIAKDFEEQGAFNVITAENEESGAWVYLAALLFSILDSSKKILKNNKQVLGFLEKASAKYGFKTLEQFEKGTG